MTGGERRAQLAWQSYRHEGKVQRKKSAALGSKSAKHALLEYGKCTVRYGKYNTVFPYRAVLFLKISYVFPYGTSCQNLTVPYRNCSNPLLINDKNTATIFKNFGKTFQLQHSARFQQNFPT